MSQTKPVKITETILRDAHQSLIATRMSTEQMLPIVEKLDQVGYHSLECWGGATFDASLRFLHEDPSHATLSPALTSPPTSPLIFADPQTSSETSRIPSIPESSAAARFSGISSFVPILLHSSTDKTRRPTH